ncbi:VTT domain-containing protein (plasmid) [Haladaptatus sp. SPP-AMP-3]|uniref:TVP38/TMEM64 family protein n=1 Tax=Haladaptatus sp. SPP-AMP-3 TaxID=3121295 RepID=UPI003C2B6C06
MEFTGNRRQVAGVGLVALVVVAGVLLSPEFVLQRVRRVTHDPLLAAGLFLAVYLVRPLFAWPTTVVAVAVGYVYGPVVGFPVALGGTVVSAYLPFAAARYFRVDSGVFGRLGDSGERFFDATGDLRGMVASRLVPAPSDAVSAAAGLSNVPDRSFLLGTAIGEVPWMVVAVLAGGSLDTLSVHEIEKNWAVVAVVGIGGLFLLVGPAYRAVTDD